MLIETYTTLAPNEVIDRLPKFLNIDQEVRGHNLKVACHLTGFRDLMGGMSSYR